MIDKIYKYLDEGANGPPDWKGKGPHKKFAKSLRKVLTKYPDMPEELRTVFGEVADFHEKESKKYTHDDVFQKDYKK